MWNGEMWLHDWHGNVYETIIVGDKEYSRGHFGSRRPWLNDGGGVGRINWRPCQPAADGGKLPEGYEFLKCDHVEIFKGNGYPRCMIATEDDARACEIGIARYRQEHPAT